MKNKRVAVLDIRSFEVTFMIGGQGVNDTFIICGNKTERYEGYSTQGFWDKNSFKNAVVSVVDSVRQNYEGAIDEVYVSVPTSFTSVKTKGHTISFPSKRKISNQDVEALFASGLNELLATGRCVERSAMYFALGDNRKYFDVSALYGAPTSLLKGALSYYFISEEFYAFLSEVFSGLGIFKIRFVPSSLAQARYLIPQKRRESYAFLLDVGFLTSSLSVVYGNGIVREESFDCGLGSILAHLINQMQVEYSVAEEMLYSANISGGAVARDLLWTGENGASYPVWKINDVIKFGLDELCEKINEFFESHYKDKKTVAILNAPLLLTGEGLNGITGFAEYLSNRVARVAETVFPDLPYYDKPSFSSRIALLSVAIGEREKSGLLYKLKNLFGGKKK